MGYLGDLGAHGGVPSGLTMGYFIKSLQDKAEGRGKNNRKL
jgi:hypothetical protein